MAQFKDNFDQKIAAIDATCEAVVVEVTEQIAAAAAQNAPVRTSSLRQSVHAVTSQSPNSAQTAASAARAANPSVSILDDPQRDTSPGVHQGLVIASAEHAVFIHNGTSSQSPRPFMEMAAAEVDLEKRTVEALKKL